MRILATKKAINKIAKLLPLLDSNQRVVAPEATALPLGQGAITLTILHTFTLYCKYNFYLCQKMFFRLYY